MATIGTFKKTGEDFNGTIKTLVLTIETQIKAVAKDSEKAPDYRIFSGLSEFGAAWKKTSREGRDYLSAKLDDPTFVEPVYASLVEGEGSDFNLIWSRRNGD